VLDQRRLAFLPRLQPLGRTKSMASKLASLTCVKILIDHHQEPDEAMFQYGVSDTSKSSTCEMVYDLSWLQGHQDKINLYRGMPLCRRCGRYGVFPLFFTHAGVHHMVAYLKELGLEHTKVHEALYDNFLENRLRFLGHVLRTAWRSITSSIPR
jgi:phosphoesterase RecJ-like protein